MQRFPEAEFNATRHQGAEPFADDRLRWHSLDLRRQSDIEAWGGQFERVDWLINCAGFLHGDAGGPEKSVHAVDSDFMLENLRINCLPTLLLAKSLAAAFKSSPTPLLATISARVGSIEDNRLGGWYSYRISKAALNMALKTLSIEWKHSLPRGCVAALHPGTNDTALSKPFQARVAAENLFRPEYTASRLIELFTRLQPADSGNFWSWDGERIAW